MLNPRHILPFLIFISCTAPFPEKDIPEREEGARLFITLENPETRSLNGSAAESWEKKNQYGIHLCLSNRYRTTPTSAYPKFLQHQRSQQRDKQYGFIYHPYNRIPKL